MPEPGSPTVRRRLVASELRRLRETANLTGDEVAERLGWSASKVSRLEKARQTPRFSDAKQLLDLYGVSGGHRDQILQLVREASRRGWWEPYEDVLAGQQSLYLDMEATAESIFQWESQVIPGLLQTEAYARAVIESWRDISTDTLPSVIEGRVKMRLERQRILYREPPLRYEIVLDEAVLRRRYASNTVMRHQLLHLLAIGELPSLSFGVIPLGGAHPIATGPFTLLRFPRVGGVVYHDVVCVEHVSSCSYIEEEDETHRHWLSFEQLKQAALGHAESQELISEIADALWD